jgi:outer membrane protein assembly factor BamB
MKKHIYPATVIACLAFTTCSRAPRNLGSAVMFHGEISRSGNLATKGLPELKGVKWKFKAGGEIWSSPIIADGTLYFGSNDRNFYAVDIESGREKWRFETGGNVRSSAAVAYGMVFFDSYDGYLYALDVKNGKQLWRFDLLKDAGQENREIPFFQWDDYTSSPLIENGVVYIGARNPIHSLFALDAFSGNQKWSFEPEDINSVRSSPAIYKDTIYFGSESNMFYALNKNDGSVKWVLQTGKLVNYGPAVDDAGNIYFACKDRYCYAVNGESGNILWKSLLAPENATWVTGFPALGNNGLVYIGSSDYHKLIAMKTDNGKVIWEFDTGGWVWSSPLYVQGIVYVGSGQQKIVFAVDGQSGKEVWRFETGGAVYASPLVANGVLYIGSADGYLYSLH